MDRLRCGASKPRARREVGFKKASRVSMWRTIADLSNRTENRALACDVLLIPSPHLWAHVQAILASAPSTTEDSKDEVQTRVYLARWLHAGAEPSRQDADQRIRKLSHARSASVVGLRRQLHKASRGQQLGLRVEARSGLSRQPAHERRPRPLRSHDAGRHDPAPHE